MSILARPALALDSQAVYEQYEKPSFRSASSSGPVTDASVHDSQVFDELLDEEDSDRSIWADSVYRSEAREEQLRERGDKRRIHRKGNSRRASNKQEQATNHRRSKVRARVEHVFGDQRTRQGSVLVRTKGKLRAAVKIGLMKLTYHMRRLEFVLRPQSAYCTGRVGDKSPSAARSPGKGEKTGPLDSETTVSAAKWHCRRSDHADGDVRTH